MTCHIIGLGPTAKHWNREGFSIGVNDCFRNHHTDLLVVVNVFKDFNRTKIVQDSRPKQLLSYLAFWASHPCYKFIGHFNPWKGKLRRGELYYSNNSPFLAASYAFNLGYDDIVLWGVDFTDHPVINDRNRVNDNGPTTLQKTLADWESFASECLKQKCYISLGIKGSLLNLPVWNPPTYS
jgi:hypothetical protein